MLCIGKNRKRGISRNKQMSKFSLVTHFSHDLGDMAGVIKDENMKT